MTRRTPAHRAECIPLPLTWPVPIDALETDPGEGSVIRGLSCAAALYALCGTALFVAWRAIAS